jgi:site-specific DNA-methyltransferase (adenine-specific)/adenine-specific DNA-methyltransferase
MPTLNWIGKDAVVNHHLHVPFHLLKDAPDLGCGQPGDGNLIVQGDNLVALKALLPYYAGQVKCIYIDPPYNTGNEGWIYNDSVNSPLIRDWLGKAVGKEAEDLSRHDKWLCMMYPRLALLRQFLRKDGAIFISLDDNEIGHARLIMDEIFGGANLLANCVWQKKYTRANDAKHFSDNHDHVLAYAKVKESFVIGRLERGEVQDKAYKNPDKHPLGPWKATPLHAKSGTDASAYTFKNGVVWRPPAGTFRRFNDASMERMDANNEIYFGAKGSAVPSRKTFLGSLSEGLVPVTFWTHEAVGDNHIGRDEVKSALKSTTDAFDNPKPTTLIGSILQIASNPGDLVLDSFAGSGTTGHAVLKLNQNAADKPPRRFILVEMEPKIARDITAERVKRVAQGYTNAKGEQVEGLGGGFRFCELGETLFDEHGQIKPTVRFADLARHVYFTETGEPLPRERVLKSPLIGECRGVGIYLLFNGILGDKSTNGGNILTRSVLAQLPKFDGQKVIYCAGCLLGKDRLQAERITIRQTPYEIKVS